MKKFKIFLLLCILFIYPLLGKSVGNVLTFYADTTQANSGSQVVINLKVKNFTSIISAQGSLQFDPSVLSFNSITQFGVPGMNNSNIGLSQLANGKIVFLWSDNNLIPQSLSNAAVFLSIKFNVIGSQGQQSSINVTNSPLQIEVLNQNLTNIPVNSIAGLFTISSPNNSVMLKLFADSVSTNTNSQVLIPVRVNNFKKIISAQSAISFDTSMIYFSSIAWMGLPGMQLTDFGLSQISNGKILFSWNDATLAGQSLQDSSVLFVIKFLVHGTVNSQTNIQFSSSPLNIEFVDTSMNIVPYQLSPGKILILATSSNSLVNIFADTVYGQNSQQIIVPVRTKNFQNIISMQGTLFFDSSKLNLLSVEQFGISDLDSSNFGFNNISNGKLSFSWFESTLAGTGMVDSSIIFVLKFSILANAGMQSEIGFINSPLAMEFIKNDLTLLPYQSSSGLVKIIGNVSLSTSGNIPVSLCSGQSLNVPFFASGYFGPGNTFYAQISDASGSFLNPTIIGSLQVLNSDTIKTIIPIGCNGNSYRIRIVSNYPNFVGPDNGSNIFIRHSPLANAGNDTSFLPASGGVLIGGPNNTNLSYLWFPSYGLSNAAVSNPLANPAVDTTYILQVSDGYCSSYDTVKVSIRANFIISGKITYDNANSAALQQVKVYLKQYGQIIDSAVSNSSGNYFFSPHPDGNYQLIAYSSQTFGGINATDALMIQRFATGLISLSPLRIKAADVNGSNSVNATDALFIKRRQVGNISTFPSGDWFFESPEVIINGSNIAINFKGICFGDVNGSYMQ